MTINGTTTDDSQSPIIESLRLRIAELEHDLAAAKRQMAEQQTSLAQQQQMLADQTIEAAQADVLWQQVRMALGRAGSVEEALRSCLEVVIDWLGAAYAQCWLIDPASQVLELQATAALDPSIPGLAVRIALGEGALGTIAAAQQPYLTNSAASDPLLAQHGWISTRRLTGFVACPLLIDERLIGMLALFSYTPLSDMVQSAVVSVAYLLALVIEHRRANTVLEAGEARLRDMVAAMQQQAVDRQTFYALAENAPDGIFVIALDGRLAYANAAFQTMIGAFLPLAGTPMADLVSEQRAAQLSALLGSVELAEDTWQGLVEFHRQHGDVFLGQTSTMLIRDEQRQLRAVAAIVRDVTEQLRAEEERRALQEQVIAGQRAVLRELSTPLIPVTDDVVVMPLIGSIDSTRAQQILEALLAGVGRQHARTAILDITGVPVVDTQVANVLVQAAQAIQLLGAKVVLTGIRPEVAQTLVGLGIDLSAVITRSTLQSGIADALRRTRR